MVHKLTFSECQSINNIKEVCFMKKNRLSKIITVLLMICILSVTAGAHPGRLDKNGGHYNRKTGEYHYHNGGGSSSGSGSSSSSSSSSSSGSSSGSASTKPTTPKVIYANKVTVSATGKEIFIGETLTATATVSPSNAKDKTLTWKSSDEKIATVDDDGVITGKAAGTVTITAQTNRGTKGQIEVTVKEIKAEKLSISANHTDDLHVGDTVQLNADFLPKNTTNQTITWQSSDPSIAKTNQKGKVTCLAVGEATITAVGKDVSAKFTIVVNSIPVEEISISLINTSINSPLSGNSFEVDTPIQLSAVVSPANATDATIVWSVSDETIAKIENDTLIGLKEGDFTLTATAADGFTESIQLSVYKTNWLLILLILGVIMMMGAGVLALIIVAIYKLAKRKKPNSVVFPTATVTSNTPAAVDPVSNMINNARQKINSIRKNIQEIINRFTSK